MPDPCVTIVNILADESDVIQHDHSDPHNLRNVWSIFCKISHVDILIHWMRLYPFASNPRRHYIQSFSLSLDKYQRGGFKAVVIIPQNTFFYSSKTLKTTLNITLLRGRRHAWKTHSIFSSVKENNASIWKQHYVTF